MPLTKMRRPKFERQDVKQSLFSVALSNQRLDKIQYIIKENNLDCLLIIIGIDSRFNLMCQQVFNYLFFDVFTTRQDDITRSCLDDFVFDDVMVCIKIDSVHVYCNGANYWLLLPYMAHWPGLQLHCISEIKMEDTEENEKFKMDCFIELTRGCNTVGVCTMGLEVDPKEFDHMVLENWPIVQSFGHDDFGKDEEKKRGFFTMVHKIVDVSSELNEIIHNSLDPISVATVYTNVLPQMEGIFENIFQLIESKFRPDDSNIRLDENVFKEPIMSYYKHLVNTDQVDHRFDYTPFVLLGSKTQQAIMQDCILTPDELEQSQVERKKRIKTPLHMILQCVNNQYDIVIGRSVFMFSPAELALNNDDGRNDDLIKDVNILSMIYNAMIVTIEDAVVDIKRGLSPGSLNTGAIEKGLQEKISKFKYESIKIRVTPYKQGSAKTAQLNHTTLLIIQAVVWDIEGYTKETLGSLVYSDTFVVTNLPTDKDTSINAVTRIGKNIQNYNYWSQYHDVHSAIKVADKLMNDKKIITVDTVDILIPSCHFKEARMFNICVFVYESQLLLYSKRTGLAVIELSDVALFEKVAYIDWCLIGVTIKSTNQSVLNNPWLWCDSDKSAEDTFTIYMLSPFRSSLRKYLVQMPISQLNQPIESNTKVQSIWNILKYTHHNTSSTNTESASGDSSVSVIDSFNDEYCQGLSLPASSSISLVKLQHSVINNSIKYNKSIIKVLCNLMLLGYKLRNGFDWPNFDWSDIKQDIIRQCKIHGDCLIELDKICDLKNDNIGTEKDGNGSEGKKVVLTILCGPPFSGQKILADKIMSVVKDNVNWQLVNPNQVTEILPQLKAAYIKTAMSSPKDRCYEENSQQRIILISPGMMKPQTVYSLIQEFVVKQNIEIGSFCTIVNSKTAVQANSKIILPGVLDMCDEGFCQILLILGTAKNSEDLERLLRIRNSLCKIHPIMPTEFTDEIYKDLDSILSLTAFNQPRQLNARMLSLATSKIANPIISLANVKKETFSRLASGFYRITLNMLNNNPSDNGVMFSKQLIVQNLTVQNDGKCKLDANKYFQQVQFIEGSVMANDSKFYEFYWSRSLCYVSMKQQPQPGPQKSVPTWIIFYIIHQDNWDIAASKEVYVEMKQSLSAAVQDLLPKPTPKKPMLTKADLSDEIINSIHTKRHLECLPEGWFFNGMTYVNMDGSKSDKHPKLPQFLEDYLDGENEKITLFNCALDENKPCLNKVNIE